MNKILGIVKAHRKTSVSKNKVVSVYYRIAIPASVLKRLGLAHGDYITFNKKSGDIQLSRVRAISTKKLQRFMGVQRIGTKNRMCLPKMVATFLDIGDGDHLIFAEGKTKSDIRICKLDVRHFYRPEKTS